VRSRVIQGFVVGLGLVSLIETAQAGPIKNGYGPPEPPSCLDLQHSWDNLYSVFSFQLGSAYPNDPGLVSAFENSILGARPVCSDLTTTITDPGAGLTDLVLNTSSNDPPGNWTGYPPGNQPNGNDPSDPTNSWTADFAGNWTNDWSPGDGNGSINVALTNDDAPTSVPEPTSLALLGSGMVGLLVTRRRRPK
jgi:hypothetical protein